MVTMTNPYNAATPVGASLGRLAQVFAQAPGPYEREAREATAEAARALAAERQLKIEESKRKSQAFGKIGELFSRGMAPAPEMPLAEGAMGPNPQMPRDEHVRGLVPEIMSEGFNAGIDDPQKLGQLVFNMFKLGGASDAQSGQAFPGLIKPNEAVSLADRESVAAREAKNDIAKVQAVPVHTAAGSRTDFPVGHPMATGGPIRGAPTESTATGTLIERAATGAEMTPITQQIIGAMDKSPAPGAPERGITGIRNYTARGPQGVVQGRTLDGVSDMTTGQPIPADALVFTGQVNSGNPGDLTRAAETDLQKAAISNTRFKSLLSQTVEMAKRDPNNFGVAGFIKGTMQDAGIVAQGVTKSLGYNTPNEAVVAAQSRLVRDGVNPDLVKGLFDPEGKFDPNLTALHTLSDLLVFSAAEALADQQGRGISDRDVVYFQRIVGDPRDWTMSQPKFLSKLDTLGQIVGGREAADAAMRGGLPAPGVTPPAANAPVVQWTRRPDGSLGPVQ